MSEAGSEDMFLEEKDSDGEEEEGGRWAERDEGKRARDRIEREEYIRKCGVSCVS